MNSDIYQPFSTYEDVIKRLVPYHLLLSNVSGLGRTDSFISEDVSRVLEKANSRMTKSYHSQYNYSAFLNMKCIIESRRMAGSKLGAKSGPPPSTVAMTAMSQVKHQAYPHFQSPSHAISPQYVAQSGAGGPYAPQQPSAMMSYHAPISLPNLPQRAMHGPQLSASQGYAMPAAFQGYSHNFTTPKGIPHVAPKVLSPHMSHHSQQFIPHSFAPPQSATTASSLPYYLPPFSQQHIFNNYASMGGSSVQKRVPSNDAFEPPSSSSSSSSIKRPSN